MWSAFTGQLKSCDPQALWSCCSYGQTVPASASFGPDPGARCEAFCSSLLTSLRLLSCTVLCIEPVVAWLLQALPSLLCMSKNLQALSAHMWFGTCQPAGMWSLTSTLVTDTGYHSVVCHGKRYQPHWWAYVILQRRETCCQGTQPTDILKFMYCVHYFKLTLEK